MVYCYRGGVTLKVYNLFVVGCSRRQYLLDSLQHCLGFDFCWLFSEAILGNYADDNTLTAICKSMDEVIRILGAEGRLALEWFEENQMKTNPDKFQGTLFGHTETETEISLGDTNIIKSSENVDLLGLIIDSKLNFSKHPDYNTKGITEINCTPTAIQVAGPGGQA